MNWHVRGGIVSPARVPALMAIVNVTPDSFSDGGLYMDARAAVARAEQCAREGAAIVDIGAESTRPGATRVSAEEQIARAVPVIQWLHTREDSDAPFVSIDTTRASVARAALQAGAHIVNDVSAGTEDAEMFDVVASAGAGLVLMHRLHPPERDSYSDQYRTPPSYADVVGEVTEWLLARADAAQQKGVRREAIVLDPGIGFGKTVAQNAQLIEGLKRLAATGYPILVGVSRKSFIGALTGTSEPADRDAASAEFGKTAVRNGAAVLRVHNVATHM